jgi:leucyl aminopeptidase
VKLKLPINLVAVVGLAENFVSSNSFRPLDIIRSRKGLTVEIGNTDAEGRLVLADCMHWVQQNYKVSTLIELSTLTGAIIIALGKQRAGLFTNSSTLTSRLLEGGEQIEELLWHMPVDDYHAELIKPKTADISNSPGKSEGSSCQAAAFLRNFVEKGVDWAHIDIAGVAGDGSDSTGYGAKLLLHYLRSQAES